MVSVFLGMVLVNTVPGFAIVVMVVAFLMVAKFLIGLMLAMREDNSKIHYIEDSMRGIPEENKLAEVTKAIAQVKEWKSRP